MKSTKEIADLISGNKTLVERSSYYFNVNDTTVRVSNHLPNSSNWSNNENLENAIFVFVGLEMDEMEIEKYLSNEFSFDFQFFIIEENYLNETIQLIKNQF